MPLNMKCATKGCKTRGGRFLLRGDKWYCEKCLSSGSSRETIVVYKDSDGHYRIPGRNDQKTPAGYERVELRTLNEIRKVQSEIGSSEHRRFEESQQRQRAHFDEIRRQNRSELRDRIKTPLVRDILEAAIRRRDAQPRKTYDAQGHYFEVTEFDRSSREPHSDSMTNWKERRD